MGLILVVKGGMKLWIPTLQKLYILLDQGLKAAYMY